MFFGFFFFKQKTAYEMRISDWSSDVCSSDLDARLDGEDDGVDGAGQGVEGAHRGGDRLGNAVEPELHLGDHAEGAFGADEEARQVIAGGRLDRKSVV